MVHATFQCLKREFLINHVHLNKVECTSWITDVKWVSKLLNKKKVHI